VPSRTRITLKPRTVIVATAKGLGMPWIASRLANARLGAAD
jgi:hypothetical protein